MGDWYITFELILMLLGVSMFVMILANPAGNTEENKADWIEHLQD